MNDFKYLWIFLLTCCYFHILPSQVKVSHPTKEVSKVKQIAQYLMWKRGASYRVAGEITKVNYSTVKSSVKTIQGFLDIGDNVKLDIDNLLKVI